MEQVIRHPAVLFILLLITLVIATAIGALVLRRIRPIHSEGRDDFNIIQGATLTLLALLIGFTLSMAVGRYDQRKNLEEEEANAIGTEYLRAELIEGPVADKVKALLVRYLDQRLFYYQTRDREQLQVIATATAQVEDEMWSIVRGVAHEKPTPITALVVAGMNDVINSQGYAEAAWLNRIPVSAWCLMIIIAFFSTLMQGYGARTEMSKAFLLFVLPVTVSLSLALIADIDSPRGGLIRIAPQNLLSLAASLRQ
ncbi:bestrophin-like domain [Cupriavidus basilensis]